MRVANTKITSLFVIASMLTTIAATQVSAQNAAQPAPPEKSLYDRLGGYNAIAAVVDDFIGRLVSDPAIGRFFVGHSTDSKQHMRQLIVDQLCQAFGGPCVYKGRDMKTTHDGLGITQADWDASVAHLIATLDKFKVPEAEKNQVLSAASGMKGQIVQADINGTQK